MTIPDNIYPTKAIELSPPDNYLFTVGRIFQKDLFIMKQHMFQGQTVFVKRLVIGDHQLSMLEDIKVFDNGFLAVGYSNETSNGFSPKMAQCIVVKFTSQGEFEWRVMFDCQNSDRKNLIENNLQSIVLESNSTNFYVMGYSYNSNFQLFGTLAKFNRTGGLLWYRGGIKSVGFTTGYFDPYRDTLFTFGSYGTTSVTEQAYLFVSEISKNGTFLRSKYATKTEPSSLDYFTDLDVSPDGRFLLSGSWDNMGIFSVFSIGKNESGFSLMEDEMMIELDPSQIHVNFTELCFWNGSLKIQKFVDEVVVDVKAQTSKKTDYSTETQRKFTAASKILESKCFPNYYGINCDVTTCHGIFFNDTNKMHGTCDGIGFCSRFDECKVIDLPTFSVHFLESSGWGEITFFDAVTTREGGIAACGVHTLKDKLNRSMVVMNFDSKGELEWVKDFSVDFPKKQECRAIRQAGDTGIVFTGISESENNLLLVIKLKNNGDLVWGKEIQPLSVKIDLVGGTSLVIGDDGSILVGGVIRKKFQEERTVFWKFCSRGKLIYEKWLQYVPLIEKILSIDRFELEENRDFVWAGQNGNNAILGRIDGIQGTTRWTRVLRKDETSDIFHAIKTSQDGNLIAVCGKTQTSSGEGAGSHDSSFFAVFTSEGNLVWTKVFNISGTEVCHGVSEDLVTSDFIFTGKYQNDPERYDIFILRMNRNNGNPVWLRLGWNTTTIFSGELFSLKYNPFQNRILGAGRLGTGGYLTKLDLGTYSCDLRNNIYGISSLGPFFEDFVYSELILDDRNATVMNTTEYQVENSAAGLHHFHHEKHHLFVDMRCWSCSGIAAKISENVTKKYKNLTKLQICNSHGVCESNFRCNCETEYLGDNCELPGFCFGIMRNETTKVCSGMGDCVDLDVCDCFSGYFGTVCNLTYCYSYEYLDRSRRLNSTDNRTVCSGGFGSCNFNDGVCECLNYSRHWGIGCDRMRCFGVINNETNIVCSGHGKCVDENNCECMNNFTGRKCEEWKCFGYYNWETEDVCNGHGICNDSEHCLCWFNYTGEKCNEWKCDSIAKESTLSVCHGGHGACISHDNCSCFEGYSGQFCGDWKCFGFQSRDVDRVCGGHGTCLDVNRCFCKSGYGSTMMNGTLQPCNQWYCGRFMMNDIHVCSARGFCVASQMCECVGGYEGDDCESWSCGYTFTDSMSCSGNGECVGPGNCVCDTGFDGKNCETNLLLASVMAPILSVAGVFGIGLICCGFVVLICVFVCCCVGFVVLFFFAICVFCLAVLILCLLILALCGVTCGLNVRVKKFGRLRNFEILLKEQEMEDDTSIAHVRVNTKLFEIKMSEILLEQILGEGGSNSIVYRAKWRSKTVAFKCFKTRTVWSTQDSFNEFEREVQVLASISHPNIIRYFGSSLEPPRVGIVMEFCEKGDLDKFIRLHRQLHGPRSYPFKKKLRIILETCRALEYLHARNIIHRDLKLENVLIDSNECAKLMDWILDFRK